MRLLPQFAVFVQEMGTLFCRPTLWHSAPLLDLLGDGGKGKQVVVVVLHLVPQDRLPARPAHEELPAVLQRVL
mgnify:CR=1 FL=1